MKQYSIKSFADLLVSSVQFKSLETKEKKLLLLDRCNWYILLIVKQNIQQDIRGLEVPELNEEDVPMIKSTGFNTSRMQSRRYIRLFIKEAGS